MIDKTKNNSNIKKLWKTIKQQQQKQQQLETNVKTTIDFLPKINANIRKFFQFRWCS